MTLRICVIYLKMFDFPTEVNTIIQTDCLCCRGLNKSTTHDKSRYARLSDISLTACL